MRDHTTGKSIFFSLIAVLSICGALSIHLHAFSHIDVDVNHPHKKSSPYSNQDISFDCTLCFISTVTSATGVDVSFFVSPYSYQSFHLSLPHFFHQRVAVLTTTRAPPVL